MSAWDDVQTEDVNQIEAAVFRQMEGRSNSDPCSPWADLALALCQRLSASEARAKELERERDFEKRRADALYDANEGLAARKEEAEREVERASRHSEALLKQCSAAIARADSAEARREEAERRAQAAAIQEGRAGAALHASEAERDEAERALRTLAESVTAYGEKLAGPEPRGPWPIWPVAIRDALIEAARALSVGVSRTGGDAADERSAER
jgi:DNA repair exonuclease SbcCD ATPase subunit